MSLDVADGAAAGDRSKDRRLRRGSTFRRPRPAPGQGGPPQIQLLALPQLDSIQRTLKILDVRLQYVQNNAKNDDKQKQDVEHIRRLMSENQLALASLVTTMASVQEEVRTMRVLFSKQHSNTFQITAPGAAASAVSIVKPRQQLSGASAAGAGAAAQKPASGASEASKDVKAPQAKPKPKPFVRMNSRI